MCKCSVCQWCNLLEFIDSFQYKCSVLVSKNKDKCKVTIDESDNYCPHNDVKPESSDEVNMVTSKIHFCFIGPSI